MSIDPADSHQSSAVTANLKPATLSECHAVIDVLALQNEQLREQMALMQERLKLDSRNSSKPPSSDGPGSGNRAQRRASQRKRGAQKGHPGSYREVLPETEVSSVEDCVPAPVCECGGAVAPQGKPVRHQVFDIPPVVAEVREYRLFGGVCAGCGRAHRAVLPPGVPTGQIGPRALALIGVLGTRYHLTQFKIRDLLAQMMGLDFSVGAISQAHGKVAAALKAPVADAMASLPAAKVLHMDETRYPREGSANWVWAAVQAKLALYSVLPSRARYVINGLIGTEPNCIVVSDRYSGYAHIAPEQRQVCWAEYGHQASIRTLGASRGVEPLAQCGLQGHLLRDFQRIADRPGQPGRLGKRLLGLGYVLFRWRERGKTSATEFEPLQRRLRLALQAGAEQPACRRTAATCANLLKLWPALWGFISHPGVEPTNNAAEQALRSIVLKRKISGPTRSRRGDEFIARGYSVVETCRRQGRDALDYIHAALLAFIDKTAPPSLLPTAVPSG